MGRFNQNNPCMTGKMIAATSGLGGQSKARQSTCRKVNKCIAAAGRAQVDKSQADASEASEATRQSMNWGEKGRAGQAHYSRADAPSHFFPSN